MIVGQLQREDALRGWFFSKNNANAGLISGGMTMRHVMHLEDEVGTGGD